MYLASKWARTAATIPRLLTVRPPTFQTFSTTSLLRASESKKPLFDDEFKHPIIEKISKNPDALLAIQNFGKVLEKQGVDLSSGKQLSMIQMSKLLMNSEFRKGAEELVEELKKTGVEVNSKDLLESFTKFVGGKGGRGQ